MFINKSIFILYILLQCLFFQNNVYALLDLKQQKEKTKDDDVSSNILNGKKMVLFANIIESDNGIKIKSEGNVFGANEIGIFNANTVLVNRDEGIIIAKENVRIRTNQNIIIYSQELENNQKNKEIKIKNGHIFLYDNSTILIQKLTQSANGVYTIEDATFSACNLKNSNEVDLERLRTSKDYDKTQNIFQPTGLNTINDKNNFEDVKKQYSHLPWSFKAEKISIDTNKEEMIVYNSQARFFSVPLFKMEKYTQKIDGKARSGFLSPEIVFVGSRQVGLGIPYYTRFKDNVDLLIRPTFFQDLSGLKGGSQGITGQTMDARRMRANILDVEYRHLLYEKNEDRGEGMFKVKGGITEQTGIINPHTRGYKVDENNNVIYGHRWHINTGIELGLGKDTYIRGKLRKASDPNFMAIYYLKYKTYKRNYIGIYKVNEDGYHAAEVIRFDPMLIYVPSATTPVVTHLRSIFEKKIDNIIGGRFLLSQRYANLKRMDGYHSTIYNGELGYTLPLRTSSGNYFNLFGSSKFDSQNSIYKGYSDPHSGYISTFTQNTVNIGSLYDNPESRMAYNGLIHGNGGSNFRNNRNYYNITMDFAAPIFTGIGRFGQFVLEPRIKYKQSPNMNTSDMILEDSLGTQLQRTNLFANNLSNGYGIIDSGKRISYGLDAYTRLGLYDINAFLSVGVLNYIGSKNTFYQEYNGLNRDISDYVGTIKFYNKYFEFSHEYRVNSRRDFTLVSGIANPRYQATTLSWNGSHFSGGLSYNKFNLLPYGQSGQMTSISPKVAYSFDNGVSIGVMGTRIINAQDGANTSNIWLNQSLSILKQTNCLFYGLTYTKNNYAIPGISTQPVVRFNVGITGI